MAELTPKEKLQPSLLDRLTDDEPDRQRESREKRILNSMQLRESVRRDLSWLLNNTYLQAIEDLSAYPEVIRSTLNYGVPDLAGRTATTVDVKELEKSLRAAILMFEPRLLQDSIRLKSVVDPKGSTHNDLSFVIEAELWAQPVPLRVFLKTDVDLETGEIAVTETTMD
jgi:type VI secretion system protein ImpF